MDPRLYIDLLKKSLLNELYIENEARLVYTVLTAANRKPIDLALLADIRRDPNLVAVVKRAKEFGLTVNVSRVDEAGKSTVDHKLRKLTDLSHTMIGRQRLDNLDFCLDRVLADKVPGDVIETGVWRGGSTVFMRGVLRAHDVRDRTVWVADSFEGLPKPSVPQDVKFDFNAPEWPDLAIDIADVRDLFERYGLLDEQVRFLKGWFKDTLPGAPISRLAVMRLDGDLYESTMDALSALYDKLSPGGFVIVDDYYSCWPCAEAVEEFRRNRKIGDEMHKIDQDSLFWRKSA